MKMSVPYNLKKVLTLGLVASMPLFSGCNDPEDPTKPDNKPTKKHNVELVYGYSPSEDWQNISMDTLYKYNADPTVDTIFMVPEQYQQFNGLSTSALKICANKLRERHNVNPQKVLGKGDLELKEEAVQNNQEIVRFFADTLGYNVSTR